MASKIYWNSALSRAHDSSVYNDRKTIGERLHKEEWKVLKPAKRNFDYETFLKDIPVKPTGEFLVNPDFDSPRYSPENRASDPALQKRPKN